MSFYLKDDHISKATKLVDMARANDGLAPLDVPRFWADNDRALKDPWAQDLPHIPMGVLMSRECVFHELGEPEDWYRLLHDHPFRSALERRYNDKSERLVGRRLLSERIPDASLTWPAIKGLHDIFEGRNVWQGQSFWLEQAARTEDELKALLDRVEQRLQDLRAFLLPSNWAEEKARLTAAGATVPLYRSQRGPVTFAMSIYGVEELIFLIMDNPSLAGRYRDLILRCILERARIMDEEAGFTPEKAPRGWSWADDNCAMLNAEMYEFFGYPILKTVFERYSPGSGDRRYQHSDSDMEHLLPLLGSLGFSGVNFGPKLTATAIRQYMPRAIIYGQLAPFTLSRNEEINMVAEYVRDAEMARAERGLVFSTAGSINSGSRLTGMRLLMAAAQRYGRLD
jgi:uroporphyrinogen decarboxylase